LVRLFERLWRVAFRALAWLRFLFEGAAAVMIAVGGPRPVATADPRREDNITRGERLGNSEGSERKRDLQKSKVTQPEAAEKRAPGKLFEKPTSDRQVEPKEAAEKRAPEPLTAVSSNIQKVGQGAAEKAVTSPERTETFADRIEKFIRSGLESVFWSAAELAAVTSFTPLGPILVRGLYLSRQVFAASEGIANGRGFNLKLSLPAEVLNSSVLPPGLQLIASVRLGERLERPDGGVDTTAEIQIFKPWFDQVDVGEVREPQGRRLPSWQGVTVERSEPAPSNPSLVWLDLLGDKAIHDLARTLSQALSGEIVYASEINPRELP
jgi:hypothetical protein